MSRLFIVCVLHLRFFSQAQPVHFPNIPDSCHVTKFICEFSWEKPTKNQFEIARGRWYDDQGRLIAQAEGSGEFLLDSISYRYDSISGVIYSFHIKHNDVGELYSSMSSTVKEYDDFGNIVLDSSFYNFYDGTKYRIRSEHYEYEYDSLNRIRWRKWNHYNMGVCCSMIEERTFKYAGDTVYTFASRNNFFPRFKDHYGSKEILIKYPNGNLKERIYINNEIKYSFKEHIWYDQYGNWIERKGYKIKENDKFKLLEHSIQEHTYNEQGLVVSSVFKIKKTKRKTPKIQYLRYNYEFR